MRRILVIGNSHAGAIKLGWDARPRHDVDVRFLVAPQRSFVQMRLDERLDWALSPDLAPEAHRMHSKILADLNGATRVNLGEFDEVVMVGWPSGADEAATLANGCQLDDLPDTPLRSTLLSRPVLRAFLADLAGRLRPDRAFWNLRGPRLHLLPRPMLAETALGSGYWTYRTVKRLHRQNVSILPWIDQLDDIRRDDLAGIGITYLPQPRETRTPTGMTGAAFLRDDAGHVDPAQPRARGDHIHMNAAFGQLSLDGLWRSLDLP